MFYTFTSLNLNPKNKTTNNKNDLDNEVTNGMEGDSKPKYVHT